MAAAGSAVERGDEVKRLIVERQLLDVADPQVGRRRALPGNVKQPGGRIHPGDGRAAAGGVGDRLAGAAPGVEQRHAVQ